MDIKEDFRLHRHKEEVVDWDEDAKERMATGRPTASYNPLSNKLRQAIPEEQLCSMFCGGRRCKYCNPSERFDKDVMAIDGLYSAWVTEGILAMSRPCTRLIEEFKIVEQFKKAGIRSVINVQRPGEHASCGDPLEPEGFAYSPQVFMDNDIYFYNFGWKDYGVTSMRTVLDMVRVMQFALSEGSVAVHCHAGLGRTGVIVACYLVFNNRLSGEEAVHYVRAKRPGALQTQEQVDCVMEFNEFMRPLRCVFANSPENPNFNLNECLRRQSNMLHGYEGRRLKNLPKIVYICGEQLLDSALKRSPFYLRSPKRNILAPLGLEERRRSLRFDAALAFDTENYKSRRMEGDGSALLDTPGSDLRRSASDNRLAASAAALSDNHVTRASSQQSIQSSLSDSVFDSEPPNNAIRRSGGVDAEEGGPAVRRVVEALLEGNPAPEVKEAADEWKTRLNSEEGVWMALVQEETRPEVLAKLLLDWLEHLKTPIVRHQDIQVMGKHLSNPMEKLKLLEKSVAHVLYYIARLVVQLQPLPDDLDEALVLRLLVALTHHEIRFDLTPSSRVSLASASGALPRMRPQMASALLRFFLALVDTLEEADGGDAMSVSSFSPATVRS